MPEQRRSLSILLSLAVAAWLALGAAPAFAFHFPWDQGHDTFEPDDGDSDTDPDEDDNCQEGSPFEVITGNFFHFEQDLYIKSLGVDMEVTRTYNSRDLRNTIFGVGWNYNFDIRLVLTTDGVNSFVVCRTGSGHRERFLVNPDGTFTAPAHVTSTLRRNADGTFTLTAKDGSFRGYNELGRLITIVERHGHALSFLYDSTGFPTEIVDSAGRSVQFFKGADGKVASIQDFTGRTYNYDYDTDGNLVRFTDPLGQVTEYEYDSKHNLLEIRDANDSLIQEVTYDSDQRVRTYLEQGERWTVTYSPAQNRTIKRDSQGNEWTLVYNDNGNITQRINPAGDALRMTFDSNSNISSMTDLNGNTTQYTYDANGNPTSVTDPLGNVTTMTYHPVFNQITSSTDPNGNTSVFEYNAAGDLVRTTNAAGQSTVLTYDGKGQLSSITDALGNTTSYVTNNFGYLTEMTDPLGNTTTFGHDGRGNVTSIVNAKGQVTTHQFNANDLVLRQTDALGNTTSFTYDARNNLQTVTDPKNNVTTFAYDRYDRLTARTDALGNSISYAYDDRGNLISVVDAKGQVTTLTYDVLDRLVQKDTPDNSVTYAYDAFGNVLSVTDDDSSVSMSYDALHRFVSTSTQATAVQPATTMSYTYDGNGNRLTMTDPVGVTTYGYNNLNRVVSLTNPLGETTEYSYDAGTRRSQVKYSNGVENDWTYDAFGHLASLTAQLGGLSLFDFSYIYDAVGNQSGRTTLAGTSSYAYDDLNQLVSAGHSQPSNPAESFAYDASGNRAASHLSSTYSYDAANRLLSDDLFTYQYEANGNLTHRVDRVSGDTTVYSYDAENQLIQVDLPDGTTATYRYDGLGRRVQKNVDGQITRYVYDGQDIVLEYDGSSSVVARYTRGTGDDDLISMARGGQSYFYHIDSQGSVVGLSDPSGNVVQTYDYDSYGQVVSQTGTVENPYRFTGREFDPETGFYYYRARYYDSATGRFIQQDPIGFLGGDYNLYAYVFNNPVNWVDPMGLAVGAPGFWESFIPVWGSGRQAIHDFQCGRWGWGLFNTAMAISDAFLVGSLVKGIAKGAWKVGSHTWGATRRWYGRTRGLARGQHVHHWAIHRNGPIGRHVPNAIKNQPWNLNPMPSPAYHRSVHGVGANPFGPFGRWWGGTPGWAKNAQGNAVGRGVNHSRGDSDCNCNE